MPGRDIRKRCGRIRTEKENPEGLPFQRKSRISSLKSRRVILFGECLEFPENYKI